MSSSLLTSDHHFDRGAVMRTAWASARYAVARNEAVHRDKWWMPLTLREAFASALRRQWDLARGHRACELHRVAQAAEAQRRATFVNAGSKIPRSAEVKIPTFAG